MPAVSVSVRVAARVRVRVRVSHLACLQSSGEHILCALRSIQRDCRRAWWEGEGGQEGELERRGRK